MRRPGVTLIETTIALGILAVGLLGMAQLQVVGLRTHLFGRRTTAAGALARDLVEAASLWTYGDPRLAAFARVSSPDDAQIAQRLDVGKDVVLTTDRRLQFGERAGDPNAVNPGALGTYQGLTSDVDGDGKVDFDRYWSVFDVDADGDGTAELKVVAVVVRWKEAEWGMRQVAVTTMRANAELFRP